MDTQTIDRARVQGLAGTAARWAAVIAAAALAACGTPRAAAAAPAGSSGVVRTFTYYAFDVNHGPADPGFIPAPGTNSKVFSQGDERRIPDRGSRRRCMHPDQDPRQAPSMPAMEPEGFKVADTVGLELGLVDAPELPTSSRL